jgi:hypothetical protein
MATYEDNDITLQLPGDWTRSQNSKTDLVQFREASGQHWLSISVMPIEKKGLTQQETYKVVERLYSQRVDGERSLLAAADPFIANGVQTNEGTALGIYSGHERASSRYFTGYVTAKGEKTIVLYLESITRNSKAHLQFGYEIFRGLTIKPNAPLEPGVQKAEDGGQKTD